MLAWDSPQNSAHWPVNVPTDSAVNVMRFTCPGIRSRLPPRLGAQKLWMTSAVEISRTTGRPTGTCSSFAVTIPAEG